MERRGHAARAPLDSVEANAQAWRKEPLPDALQEARTRPEWSALNPDDEETSRHKQIVQDLTQ